MGWSSVLGILIDTIAGTELGAGPFVCYGIGDITSLAGAAVIVAALNLFRQAGTRPEPWKPTTAIVGTGIYGVTRNPMYVGMVLAYLGLSLAFDSLAALLLLPVLVLVLHFGVMDLPRESGERFRCYAACLSN